MLALLGTSNEAESRRMAKNIPKFIRKGFNAALADGDRQTVTKELGGIHASLMECAEKFGQNSPPDEMKESPVRNKLRRKLEDKRAKARTAASNEQVNLGPILCAHCI